MKKRSNKTVDEQFAEALVNNQFEEALASEIGKDLELPVSEQTDQAPASPSELGPDDLNAKTSLSRALLEREYHPVLIFGVSASGKTTLLTSLLNYFLDDASAETICILGEPILPDNTPCGSRIHQEATRFFNRVVADFSAGVAAPSTRFEFPFFIPVEIRPRSGKSVRVALLESRGEFWTVNKNKDSYFPTLKNEIIGLYRNYPDPISIMIVAPFALSDTYAGAITLDETEQFRECDAAILSSLQSYQQLRKHPANDKFLLLLSKWDLYSNGIGTREFAQPPEGEVETLIHQRFPRAWGFYQSMPQNGGKAIINYSAGVISGTDSLPIPGPLRQLMYRYPRKVWNWIYSAATGGGSPFPGDKRVKKNWFRKLLDVFT